MTTLDALRNARELYLSGKHRFSASPECFDHLQLLVEASSGLGKIAADALELLDECTPGRNFGFWIDGGRWTDDGAAYDYNRTPAEIAAVMGKSIMRAMSLEGT